MNQRHCPRVRRALPIGLSSYHRPLGTFTTRDLSVDGLFLRDTPVWLQPHDRVMLHVETSLAGIPMLGDVVRRTLDGVAIHLDHRYLHYAHDVMVALEEEGRIFSPDEAPDEEWLAASVVPMVRPMPGRFVARYPDEE